MEKKLFPDPRGLALLAVGVLYLLATPGVLPGFWDTYISAPFQRARAPAYGPVRPPPLLEVTGSPWTCLFESKVEAPMPDCYEV